jgi:hypothetical protein
VSENRVLKRIFGLKREEVAGGWRRLHNEELHNLYASPDIIWAIKLSGMSWKKHVARMVDMRYAYKILVGELGRKRAFGRPMSIWEGNIRIDLRNSWIGRIWLRIGTSGEMM